jgi:outer membrane protein assembly factor BamB
MKKLGWLAAVFCLVLLATLATASPDTQGSRHWPQWRGPLMTGVAPHGNPPLEWSETKNVRWKVEIPGKGSASPVVWGDLIFIQTAVPTENKVAAAPPSEPAPEPAAGPRQRGPRGIPPEAELEFTLLALRRSDGKLLWKKVLRTEVPHEGTHQTGSWASNSPVTDGEHVYAFFGSRGVFALDMKGKLKWEKDLGDMRIKLGFGEGASPALYKDRLIINWDHEGESFVVALDKRSGKELWRVKREEATSWTTPLVVEHNGGAQVVTSATSRIRSYDLADGKLLWESDGMTANTIPTPVAEGGMLYLTSGFRGNSLMAVKLDAARGNLSETQAVVWRFDRDTPYVPSPLLYNGRLYFLKSNNGILSCFDARTGRKLYGPQRIESVPNVYASPVGAAGRIYLFGREGGAAVLADGPEFKLLAQNTLEDGFDASPAIVGNEMYVRGKKYLYRISE